jgi:hypothetical protein
VMEQERKSAMSALANFRRHRELARSIEKALASLRLTDLDRQAPPVVQKELPKPKVIDEKDVQWLILSRKWTRDQALDYLSGVVVPATKEMLA